MIDLELWAPDESTQYDSIIDEVMGLTYSSGDPGGDLSTSWNMVRDPRTYWRDLAKRNVVKLRNGPTLVWKGRIMSVAKSVKANVGITVEADGMVGKLKEILTVDNLGNERLSAWMTAHLFTEAHLGMTAGTVGGADYVFPYGIEASPQGIYHAEMMERGNRTNGYYYGCRGGQGYDTNDYLDYYPKPTAPAYYVDGEWGDWNLAEALEGVENYIRYSWTVDGSITRYAVVQDATSQAAWGRRDGKLAIQGKCDAAAALVIANIALDGRKLLKPKTAFTAWRVTDARGIEIPIPEVTAIGAPILRIEGLYPAEQTIADAEAINELSTFGVVEATVDAGNETVSLAPGKLGLLFEKVLARAEAMQADDRSAA